jgi:hypothetical protein
VSERWSERLSRWFGHQARRAAPIETVDRGRSIEIIIGIDYGTRFTKVAIGREGQEPAVWTGYGSTALIPSIVYVTKEGSVLPWPDDPPRGAIQIEYLKMLLAKPHDSIFHLPSSILAGQKQENVIKALAALFLSEIIRRAQKSELDRPHLRNANIRWLVNVGVPVEHFDAEERDVFREVASVACKWNEAPPSDLKVAALASAYQEQAATINQNNTPTSVFPELAAALTEYIRDPNRPEGLFYGFCDIGGGTIDGAIFRLHRTSGLPRLAILSASVAPYGTAALARSVVGKLGGNLPTHKATALSWRVESLLTEKQAPPVDTQELAAQLLRKHQVEPRTNVQNFVRWFVNEARMKRNVNGHTFADPVSGEKIELRFFLAGGGAESGWYKTTIQSLDPKDNQAFDGIKKVRLETVKRPAGFRGTEFPRFVIALGLTKLPDELEEASRLLPSKIKKKPPLPEREAVRATTKDDM